MGNLGWIDSHAHLVDESLWDHADDILLEAQRHQVNRILSISTSIEEAMLNLSLRQKYEMIDIAVGFHPSDAHVVSKQDLEELKILVQDKNIIAVGEIGLDYYWDKEHINQQKELFIYQIELANAYEKPIIIHNRDSTQDVLDILKQHPAKYGGVMHCYSGSVEMSFEFIKQNMYISFAGPLTFKNARVPKEVAQAVPIERLLIETDSPYLTPHPLRGKRNQPAYVSYVGKELSRIKEISQDELKRLLAINYESLFSQKMDKCD
jgi:TatD DNase family protein